MSRPAKNRPLNPRRIGVIVMHTFTQLVRMKVFYFLGVFAVILLASNLFNIQGIDRPDLEGTDVLRSIRSWSLGTMTLFSVVLGVVATALETITARSLGKMLVGGCVTTVSGSRTAWRMILWRGAVRMVVALVPPLAVFALTNPHMRGLHDMAAKTLVLATDLTEPSRST